ncbi:hypothetical protein FD754_001947 [Muntiacus muntjak]|uniref:Aquaporin-10 n=1 Tax=Muntiacus muntjak TaxID=9888 RepID=A0A5N3W7Z4_MUNMU|nr:hypothetical protein FD754_001947 [Muntiacus muntjak]
MLLIQGSSAQAVTSGGTKGNFFAMFLAGSLGVTLAIYVSGNVSGEEGEVWGHVNPAFSLPMCLLGRLPWAKFLIYSLVQLLSAFCASGVTYALYYDALQNYTGGTLTVAGPKEMASIFATYPAPYLSLSNGFLDQWGLLILAITLSMGANCGLPINPAQDLGPRLFTYIAGWGPEVFSAGNGWWWVPVVGPLVGAALGTATHQLLAARTILRTQPSQNLPCAQQEASDSGSPAATQLQESKLRL